ncbi:MAG TPA: nucleotide exchange factor GrpE [Ktedonobacteraceae bacterium]|jgi:molecular chaperone GrpE|nr:nucleotide exchange factor GrpE [Ktedonobacteraceae bacterium]
MQEQGAENKIVDAQPSEEKEQDALSQLQHQLEEEQHKTEEYLNLLKRTQADFVNYKRRAAQEQAEGRTIAQGVVIESLLPVLDDLKRALESAPTKLASNSWVKGVTLAARRLTTTLQELGVQQLGEVGEAFDPRKHEALMTEARSDKAEGTILQVYRPGYTLRERVLRPAQVVVATAPEETAQPPSEEKREE